jgi:hypothetical protein
MGHEAVSMANRIWSSAFLPLKMGAILSIETSVPNYPGTQCPILQEENTRLETKGKHYGRD